MLQNHVQLIGHCGGDPEIKYLPSGVCVANLTLATSEKYTDKKGEKCDHVEWHDLTFWDKSAQLIEKYVKKGSKLIIAGKIRTESWEKDGVTHYRKKILVETFQFLSPTPTSGVTTNSPTGTGQVNSNLPPQNDELSDLPF